LAISGSAGMGFATDCKLPFVQEVFATRVAAQQFSPDTDVIIELGGEDAKILFLSGGMDVRMNGSCAGGTGAFIDQMATLLKMSAEEMNEAALRSTKLYTIASRCGVFAKSDVQPLLNQGARKEDVAASIFSAVVNQTIAGLAQGRPIAGRVMYLGGPITFLSALKNQFDASLGIEGRLPENSLYYVAMGAALYSDEAFDLCEVADRLEHYSASSSYVSNPPLFANAADYEEFRRRHALATVPTAPLANAVGALDIGIDAGSTTVKVAVLDEEGSLVYQSYQPNSGNPVPLIKAVLEELYAQRPDLAVHSATATGYGEEIIKNAFSLDFGIVETIAHFTAAKHFMPNVDFVIDIGGQDMKCFKIEDGAISDIYLNEACSS
ncbi:MAG: BadF/BadG/BcrA/BcrD ATPase family protein, partial [Pygmaiobacter sp.]